MNWQEIDKEDLPEVYVLAANFEEGTYGYGEKILGYVHDEEGTPTVENEYEILSPITHFIYINLFDKT